MLAVVVIEGALLLRGPDLNVVPVMAEQPVELPDGALLYVQQYETSIADWNACYVAGAYTLALRAPRGRVDAEMPTTGISFVGVTEYLTWMNRTTGLDCRLPTVSEWEQMAAEVLPDAPDPIFTSPELTWASAYLLEPQIKRTLRRRGSLDTTSQGIVDLNGSVWE